MKNLRISETFCDLTWNSWKLMIAELCITTFIFWTFIFLTELPLAWKIICRWNYFASNLSANQADLQIKIPNIGKIHGEESRLTTKVNTWHIYNFSEASGNNIRASFPFNVATISSFWYSNNNDNLFFVITLPVLNKISVFFIHVSVFGRFSVYSEWSFNPWS